MLNLRAITVYVQLNMLLSGLLQNALQNLGGAIHEVNAALEQTRADHAPLAMHIFTSRREHRAMADTKSGKRHEIAGRLGWTRAQEMGFRGSLSEWGQLMDASPKR
jgi:hypothetical protein